MQIPARAVLAGQLHCLSDDGKVVITAQRWSDPAAAAERPRSWLRLIRNGRPRAAEQFGGRARHLVLEQRWSQLADRYAATALSEADMWAWLGKLAQVEQVQCSSASKCAGRLPVGWHYCPECGRDERNVASGSLSGARRRVVLWDLRKPAS